jgi:hypothetical protein
MNDPAYDGGVRSDSVVEMVTDMGQVFLGMKQYISAPEPIDGIQPVTHISFKDNSLVAPQSLEIKPRGSSKKHISRRSQLYNESRSGVTPPSRQPSIRKFDPATESIIGNIDRAMERHEISDDENNIVEDDEDRMSHMNMPGRMSPEPTEEMPAQEMPMEKPTRRVVSRRRVQS